jgi:hypothetical protein
MLEGIADNAPKMCCNAHPAGGFSRLNDAGGDQSDMAITINEGLLAQTKNLLASNAAVKKINFGRFTFTIWPEAYSSKIPKLLDERNIGIDFGDPPAGAAASFSREAQQITLKEGFSFVNTVHQSILIHELTHLIVYSLGLGKISAIDDECCGYIAEAVYAAQTVGSDLGGTTDTMRKIRKVAYDIGQKVLKGTYHITLTDWGTLKKAIMDDSIYLNAGPVESSGISSKAVL